MDIAKVLFAGILLALITLTGCGAPTGHVISDPDVVRLGGLFHLSGDGSVWGVAELRGTEMAIDALNARGTTRYELLVEDCATDFPKTATATWKLINVDGVDAIVGPTWFGQVVSPIVKDAEVLTISPSAGVISVPSPYFYTLWPSDREEIKPIIRDMTARGYDDVTIFVERNDWSESMKDLFLEEAASAGIATSAVTVDSDTADYRTLLLKEMRNKPDAFYLAIAWYPTQGRLSTQLVQLGNSIPVYSTSGTENHDLLTEFPAIHGTIYSYPEKTEKQLSFEHDYQVRYGELPGPSAAHAYDSVMLLAAALDSDNRIAYLQSLRDEPYDGLTNAIAFDTTGKVLQKAHVLKQVEDGQFTIIS